LGKENQFFLPPLRKVEPNQQPLKSTFKKGGAKVWLHFTFKKGKTKLWLHLF